MPFLFLFSLSVDYFHRRYLLARARARVCVCVCVCVTFIYTQLRLLQDLAEIHSNIKIHFHIYWHVQTLCKRQTVICNVHLILNVVA